jgi:endonuclease III-like uncharacterized protein
MKNFLPLIFFTVPFFINAQVNTVIPPEAGAFYSKAMPSIKPVMIALIKRNSINLRNRNVNADSLLSALKKDASLKGVNQHSVDAILVLIMIQMSINLDAELKDLVLGLRNDQTSKEGQSLTEEILDHKSRLAETVTFVFKKISSPESAINNLK